MSKLWLVLSLVFAELLAPPASGAPLPWMAGLAKVRITPGKPLWMGGFSARTRPSEGVLQELYAKALALEDRSGRRAVLVTADVSGFSAGLADNVAARAGKQYRLAPDRLLLNASHTHSGPAQADPLKIPYWAQMSAAQWRDVEDYTRELEGKLVAVIGAAVGNLQPARLSFGRGSASFAVNRRVKTERGWASFRPNPEGPADHDAPFLRVDSAEGQLRGIVFGYACHPSCLMADNYLFSGDYAGFAQESLEGRHPGAVALFLQGFGADAMVSPRGTVKLAREYGEMLAAAVEAGMEGSPAPVRGPLKSVRMVFPLAFAPAPSREEFAARLRGRNQDARLHAQEVLRMMDRGERLRTEYPYPLQVWQFSRDLTLVALAGEVVVDYAARLKKELGPGQLWLAGYSNDVFAYIPSERVLREGGYEGGEAMFGARLPGPFAPGVEETIVRKVHEAVARVRGR